MTTTRRADPLSSIPPSRVEREGDARRGLQVIPTRDVAPSAREPDRAAVHRGCAMALMDAGDVRVEAIWRTLETAARPSYFLTWGWIETWLSELPPETRPRLAVLSDAGAVVAACFLGHRRVLRHHVLPLRARFLNTTGIPQLDELCIEHNGVLCLPGRAVPLAALVERLPRDWDELVLPAIDAGAFDPLAAVADHRVLIDRDVAAPFVDLARVRAAGDYPAVLGSNTRAQIRRARRTIGPCELEVAGSVPHALAIYDELVALHTARWRERGQPGAFADPWFDRFHRELIRRRFAHGELELLRLRAGATTVGCIYNLISSGRVLFYQSGLAPFANPHVKPGYLCHAAAIERAAAAGHATYDLLGGDARYKASLSTGATRLVWLRVQRRLARFTIEQQLQRWKRGFVAWRATRRG
jgi:CelD/BcsL family acetyltransferase involved in cellulose biosynthesis